MRHLKIKRCLVCGKNFIVKEGSSSRKNCKEFTIRPSMSKTCSKKCSAIYIRIKDYVEDTFLTSDRINVILESLEKKGVIKIERNNEKIEPYSDELFNKNKEIFKEIVEMLSKNKSDNRGESR